MATKKSPQPRLSALQMLQARMASGVATPASEGAAGAAGAPTAPSPILPSVGGLMSALTGEANTREAVVAAGKYQQIPVELIDFDPDQPRKTFDPDAIASLAASIAATGLLQLPIVRPHPQDSSRYMVVVGERRIRALKSLKTELIEVRFERWDDTVARAAQIVENSEDARVGVSAWDEAHAFQDLLNRLGSAKAIVDLTGHSYAKVSKRLALLSLPEPVKELVSSGVITDHEAAYDLGTLYKANPEAADAVVQQASSSGMLERQVVREALRESKATTGSPTPTSAPKKTAAAAHQAFSAVPADLVAAAAAWGRQHDAIATVVRGKDTALLLTVSFATADGLEAFLRRG